MCDNSSSLTTPQSCSAASPVFSAKVGIFTLSRVMELSTDDDADCVMVSHHCMSVVGHMCHVQQNAQLLARFSERRWKSAVFACGQQHEPNLSFDQIHSEILAVHQ